MSTRTVYTAIGLWMAIVVLTSGLGWLSGVPVTVGWTMLALVIGLMPSAIFLKLFSPREEPQPIAQLLKARP